MAASYENRKKYIFVKQSFLYNGPIQRPLASDEVFTDFNERKAEALMAVIFFFSICLNKFRQTISFSLKGENVSFD